MISLTKLFIFVYGIAILSSQFVWAYNLTWPYTKTSDYALENEAHIHETLLYLSYQTPNLGTLDQKITTRERMHMYDVKKLFGIVHIVMIQSLLLTAVLAGCIAIADKTNRRLWKALKKASFVWTTVIAVTSLLAYVFFKQLFLVFHKMAFTNDFWLLPTDATLIKLFPESTFLVITVITLLSTLALHFLLGVAMSYADNYSKTKQARNH